MDSQDRQEIVMQLPGVDLGLHGDGRRQGLDADHSIIEDFLESRGGRDHRPDDLAVRELRPAPERLEFPDEMLHASLRPEAR